MSLQKTTAPVPNYLVGGILATIFCCLPTGIASIVYASRANSKVATGDIQGARADSKKSRFWILFSFFATLIVGGGYILAAIVMPAYQDYKTRTEVSSGILAASALRANFTNYVNDNKAWPAMSNLNVNANDLYIPGKYAIEIDGNHNIQITFYHGKAKGMHIYMTPVLADNSISSWTCTSDMPKYAPASCRQ